MSKILNGYTVVCAAIPDFPNTIKFIHTQRKTIYINTARKPGANIIRIINSDCQPLRRES